MRWRRTDLKMLGGSLASFGEDEEKCKRSGVRGTVHGVNVSFIRSVLLEGSTIQCNGADML